MEMMRQTPSSSLEVGADGESPAQAAPKIIANTNKLRLTIPVYNRATDHGLALGISADLQVDSLDAIAPWRTRARMSAIYVASRYCTIVVGGSVPALGTPIPL